MDRSESSRRVDAAEFTPIRLAGPRRRVTAVIIGAWILGFSGLVALGAFDRLAPDGAALAARSTEPGIVAIGAPVSSPGRPGNPTGPARDVAAATSQPLVVVVRPVGDAVEVSGVVLDREVASVSVSIIGPHDLPFAVRSISVPDQDGGIRPSGGRSFSIRIDVPSVARTTAVEVEIDAYDALGASIGSPLIWLGGHGQPCGPGWPCGDTAR